MRLGTAGAIAAAIGAAAISAFAERGPAAGAPPRQEEGPPEQLASEHFLRLKILEVAPVERTDRSQLLQLKVRRFYGKIEAKSLERNQERETQEFTILLPAAPGAAVKVGDIIDYQAVRYMDLGSD